jgi:hypothetical protein
LHHSIRHGPIEQGTENLRVGMKIEEMATSNLSEKSPFSTKIRPFSDHFDPFDAFW